MGPVIVQWLQTIQQFPSSRRMKRDRPRPLGRLGAIALLGFCACLLGIGLSLLHPHPTPPAQAQLPTELSETDAIASVLIGTIDPIPSQYQLGSELYLETCTTCHIGVPPQVLPTQSWSQILNETWHYGVQLPPLVDPPRLLIWQYVQFFSRSVKEEEAIPSRLSASRYFTALHPRVTFESRITLNQCASCHPGADAYNFRQLTAEWDNAP
ncbi:MAG: diheme cytochrome C [Leptolyngbyaceae cyanobacterium]